MRIVRRVAPDLVFTDMLKPGSLWAGEDLARAIRATPHVRHVPSVLSSGWPRIEPRWRHLFDDFFMIPFKAEQLLDFITAFFRDRY